MEIHALQAIVADELYLTLHASPESYTIVAIQTVLLVLLMRPMLQMKSLAVVFAPWFALGGLAGIRAAQFSGVHLGDSTSSLLFGSTAGMGVALIIAVLVVRLGLDLLALRKPLTLASRQG